MTKPRNAAPAPETVEALSLDLLRPDPKNARRISEASLSGLQVSMHEFGDLSGITWNEELGDLVAGHQRMKGLRVAGAKTWVRLSADEGLIAHPVTGERFSVRIVRWDVTKHRAAQIVANNPHIEGEFVTEDVLAQLKELESSPLFDDLQLDELQKSLLEQMGQDETPAAGNTDPDDVPEPPAVPITKPGDLWLLGTYVTCPQCGKHTDVDGGT